jgi:PhzF family phenazine biosynthesis protein
MLKALGIQAGAVTRNQFDYMVEVESEAAVGAMAPDFTALKKVEARGIIVTARASTPAFDFVSRFFAPAVGIDEDPVTGSAHCALGPYWGKQLGKTEMNAYQASARGGVVRVRLNGDRVILGGQAVTVMTGELAF